MRVTYFLLFFMAASFLPLGCVAKEKENSDSGSLWSKNMYGNIGIYCVIFFVILFCLAFIAFLTGLCCSNCFRTPRTMADQEMGSMVTCTAFNYKE